MIIDKDLIKKCKPLASEISDETLEVLTKLAIVKEDYAINIGFLKSNDIDELDINRDDIFALKRVVRIINNLKK